MERLAIHGINNEYLAWENIIESDYELLGLADDVFVSPVRYYFNSKSLGIIFSKNVLIIFGDNKNKIRKEIARLKRKVIHHRILTKNIRQNRRSNKVKL